MSNQRVVVLADEEIVHTAAWLRASTVEINADLVAAWEATPVGRTAVALEAALEHLGGITDERVEDGAMAAWEHKTAHIVPLCPWDLLDETERAEQVERFRAGLEAVELPIWPDAERKAIAHADLYTTGGLLRALQNAIEEASAFESTPYNLRVLATRALVVARRREMHNPSPDHSPPPSMVRKDG